jgi:8-oxo-dGTP diphosphatase
MLNNKVIVAVKAIVNLNGNILIVRRSDTDDVGAGSWELPGGKLDFGEEPANALIREVKEEVGLDITVENIAYVTSFMSDPTRQVIIIAYQCNTNQENIVLSTEHTEYIWANKEEVIEYLPSNILADFKKCKLI